MIILRDSKYSEDKTPRWSYWRQFKFISFEDAIYLSLNINPHMIGWMLQEATDFNCDEISERTIDGLNAESQAAMEAFLNDQSDIDEQGPPSYNPALEQVDKEMALRRLSEANISMFKKMRRRRIFDDDDNELPNPRPTRPV